MKHAFYFRFFKYIHNERLSCILARMAYSLYMLLFNIKKTWLKKYEVTMSVDQAHSYIDNIYPKPKSKQELFNPPIDDTIDLSVVIPVYNYADVLEEMICSILNQKTRYHYEIIFVDDGSTDGALDILNKYAKKDNVTVISQANGGIGSARNTGINNAKGKYLMFMDCDDKVQEDIVQTLLDKAYEINADMVIAAHNLVKQTNGQITKVLPNIYPNTNLIGYKNGDEIMNFPGLPWAKVYKRSLWNNVRFFPGYWYEDTIIHFLLFTQCNKYSYIPKVVYEYKWYEKNFSHTQGHSSNNKAIDRYWLLLEIIEQYKKIGLPEDKVFYTVLLRHLSVHFYNNIRNLEDQKVTALFVLCKEIFDKYYKNDGTELPYILSQVEKSFLDNNIELWKLACCFW